jgi:hypothetical protein
MSTTRAKTAALGTAALALALQGCLSIPVNLRSDPAGATVLANGKVIGTTPMQITADDHFPHQRKGLDWHRDGTLTLQRPGCTPKSLDIDNDTLKRSMTVDLDCRPDAPVLVAPAASAAATGSMPAATLPSGAATQRLEELESLRSQNLITAEEYRSIRKRILDQL